VPLQQEDAQRRHQQDEGQRRTAAQVEQAR
jgi:hypothetical protein